MKKQSTQGKKNVALSAYNPKKKVSTSNEVVVYGKKGSIKILDGKVLLPKGLERLARFGRIFKETFDPQYGYGTSDIAGRFAFAQYNGRDVSSFGWSLASSGTEDQSLEVNLFMGTWGGIQTESALIQAVLEVEVSYNPPGPGLVVSPHLEVTINGSPSTFIFRGDGNERIKLVINRPADANFVNLRFTYRRDSNAGSTGMFINRIDRYSDILFQNPFGSDWSVLETI
jgi:hypothetical protein